MLWHVVIEIVTFQDRWIRFFNVSISEDYFGVDTCLFIWSIREFVLPIWFCQCSRKVSCAFASGDGVVWRVNLVNMRWPYLTFLFTGRKTDYWSVLEQPPKGMHIEVVRAAKSDRWTPDIMARLKEAEAKKPDNVTFHMLENAGHWLHTDNPSGLIAIMAPILARISQ